MGLHLWNTGKVSSLSDANVEGITFYHFLADTNQSRTKKNKASHKSLYELVLDESDEKHTKLSTTYTPVDRISGLNDVSVCLTNHFGYLATVYAFDGENPDHSLMPTLAAYDHELLDILATKEATDFKKERQGSSDEVKLAYYVLHAQNAIITTIATFTLDIIQQSRALDQNWDDLSTRLYNKAAAQFLLLKTNLKNALDGNIAVPESTLWENLADKSLADAIGEKELKARLGIGATKAHPLPPSNGAAQKEPKKRAEDDGDRDVRRKVHNDPGTLGADGKDGYIVVPQGVHVTLPKELNGARPGTSFSLCWQHYRKGATCSHKQTCNRSHKAPKDLGPAEGKALWAFMFENEKGLSWNADLVNVEELRRKFGQLSTSN
jgi:hypothetical protein